MIQLINQKLGFCPYLKKPYFKKLGFCPYAFLIYCRVHIPKHTRSLSGSLLGYKTIP